LAGWDQAQVTWNQANTGVAWSAPGAASGADRGSQPLCTVLASATGPLTVALNDDGLALVQGWIDNPGSNHGIVIADPDTGDGADFHSSESSTALARPRLNITYSVAPVTNVDPVAGFTASCTDLDCNFIDTSTDSDGSIVAWDWDFGDGNTSTAQNPQHSYAADGTYTVSLTVSDDAGAIDSHSSPLTVSGRVTMVDYTAVADLPSAGSVGGSYLDTHDDDQVVESITERESGGKPNSRYSYLSHSWQFNVAPASTLTVMANAWSGGSSDGDTFRFEWSADNVNFSELFIVSSTSESNVQSAVISASGTLYIRVTDTDQTQGARALDTVYVDQLIIRADNTVPTSPPDTPAGLQVDAATSESITLSWQHDDDSEQGFELQRKLASSGSWPAGAISIGAGSTGYTDTGLDPATAYDYRLRAVNGAGNSAWSNTASGATLEAPAISLDANGYKIKGVGKVDLTWSGAGGSQVDIVRDEAVIATVVNSGNYTDDTRKKGGATYVYRVCEAGSAVCSNDVIVVF